MKQSLILAMLTPVVFGACTVHRPLDLTPAPAARTIAGTGKGAVDTTSGVRIEARPDAWQWNPTDLGRKVTPLFVELDNTGSHRVLVRYNKFTLTTTTGERYAAMPPYDLDVRITESYTVRNPYYPVSGFAVAPYLRPYYPVLSPYDGAFVYDQPYYNPYITTFRKIQLPTADMVQRALPEGVLEPGGKISGFIYFERIHDATKQLEFMFDLVDATSNQSISSAHIPFVRRD